MNESTYIFFSIFLLILALGSWFKKRDSDTEVAYLLADRKTKLLPLIATLVMTEFNTSTLIGFSALGYVAGLWGLAFPSIFLFGLLFYTFIVSKKWRRTNATSVAELFTNTYGSLLGKVASLSLVLAMFAFSANYLKSMQMLLHPLFPYFSPEFLTFIILSIAIGLVARGGLGAIVRLDTIGFIAVVFFLPLLFYFAWNPVPESKWDELKVLNSIDSGQTIVPPSFVLSLIFLTCFTYIASPWYGQKIFSSENESIAYKAVGISAVLVFFLYSLPVLSLFVLQLREIPLSNPENGISYILSQDSPDWFKGFGYAVLFAVGATTLSGVLSAVGTMAIADFAGVEENRSSKRAIWILLLSAGIVYLLSILWIDKVLDKLILANIPIAALSFALLAAFYWNKANSFGAWLSWVVGIVVGTGSYLIYGNDGLYTTKWAFYGIPAIFLSGILGSILYSIYLPKNAISQTSNDNLPKG